MENESRKYTRIAGRLTEEIADGKYAPLGSIPSERALMRRFGVSRHTIRLAIDKLEADGILHRRQGSGTYLSRTAGKMDRGVGILVSGGMYSEIFATICREISQLAGLTKFRLHVGDASYRNAQVCARKTIAMARKLVEERVCGVIYQPVQFFGRSADVNRAVVELFAKARMPVVLIDCDIVDSPERSGYDVVGIDNFDAGRRVAAHLVERGARHIRFACAANSAMSVQCRCHGARSIVGAGNGEILWKVDPTSEKAVRSYLGANADVDAVICQNDIAAVSLLATLKKIGVSVPADLFVAGFDDLAYAKIANPPLTTIHQPCRDIAKTAYGRLLERIENPNLVPVTYALSAPLVVRESTMQSDRP